MHAKFKSNVSTSLLKCTIKIYGHFVLLIMLCIIEMGLKVLRMSDSKNGARLEWN